MVLKAGFGFLAVTSLVTTVVGTTTGNGIVAIVSVLSALLVATEACFITHYLKHISDHKNVIEKADCERNRSELKRYLCLIVKHFGIDEESDSVG